jgi:restriction endonuclease S subunit
MRKNYNWIDQEYFDVLRSDAEYYKNEYIDCEEKIRKLKHKKLGEITKDIKDGPGGWSINTSEYVDYGIPMLRTVNIIDGLLSLDNCVYITQEKHKSLRRSKVIHNDVLLSVRGTIGKSAVYNKDTEANLNAAVVKITVDDSIIDPYYLSCFFNCKYGRLQTERISNGAVQKNMNLSEVKRNLIPIPSPEIQKYIGDKVRRAEELREEAKRLKEEAEEILSNELRLNELIKMIEENKNKKHNVVSSKLLTDRIDPYYYKAIYTLVNSFIKDNKYCKLKEIAKVNYGYMPTEDYASKENGRVLIRVTNMIGNLLIDLTDVKYVNDNIDINDDKKVTENDILVVQCGNTTGKIALIDSSLDGYLFPSFCLRVRLNSLDVNPRYLALLMESEIIQQQIWQSASYSSVRPNTTKPAIEELLIPIIDTVKQEKIGVLIEKYINYIKESKQLIQQAKKDVEDLIEGNFDMSELNNDSSTESRC